VRQADALRFPPAQHEFCRIDPHMQRAAETRTAQQTHAFSDAKTERHQTLAEFVAGIKG